MHRKDKQMDEAIGLDILAKGDYGYLSTADKSGTPYGVPLNYAYDPKEHSILFHCALVGKKLNHLRVNPRVSFCVVGRAVIVPEQLTSHYQSVIVDGTADIVEDFPEKKRMAMLLCQKFAPEQPIDDLEQGIQKAHWVKIKIDSLSTKGVPM